MSRTIIAMSGMLAASSLLLVDWAVKGSALLLLAAVAAVLLRRDSAATRHLAWLLAIVATLFVPVLSALLPQWRVLPEWASVSPPAIHTPAVDASVLPQIPTPGEIENGRVERGSVEPGQFRPVVGEWSSATAPKVAAETPDSSLGPATREVTVEAADLSWTGANTLSSLLISALPILWAIGFTVLILRLAAARWVLWNCERRGTLIWSSANSLNAKLAMANGEPIATAANAVSLQLGIRRPVTVLIHHEKSIPVVWGVFRCCLLLPAAARDWSGEQLRSVLLHELAHIRRRDTLAQLLTQIACALHWFNPLVWFAAWRMGVERERACDDLVLASGVRPSAYAGHLLDVVTGHSPARWSQACGLAMARQSSLEGRLVAVLNERLNRRGVTTALAAAALLLGVGIAVPLAMLCAAEPDKPKTETAGVNAEPKDAKSRPLFENWKTSARTDGKIPGGRIGDMAASLKTFMDRNPGHEQSVKLEPVLKKCDASRDWTPAEAAALLDEIAAITPQAEWTMRAHTEREREIHPGKPLPGELADAPWGKPTANGLRIAWLLEPRAETQALDSVMKSRVLFHNAGKTPVCFATKDWIQTGGHKAKDASGKDISVWAVMRLGIRLRMNFRLAPGEYAEVEGHGLGVGSHEALSVKSIYEVPCWIEAKEGDVVTFTPGSVPVSFQTWLNKEVRKDSVTVWQEMIAARVRREGPMPAAAADREQLLRRVMQDFPGTAPIAAEIAAFTADNAPDALARLIKSLQARAGAMHFAGELSGRETKFRVTAAVPKKDKPKQGAKLQPGTEEKLQWGEPAGGLRMALAWPPVLGEPAAGEVPDLHLAVQNVSKAPVRLCTTAEATVQRRLTHKSKGTIQFRIVDDKPAGVDCTLAPGEAVFLRLFTPDDKPGAAPVGAEIASGVRRMPDYFLVAEMEISNGPAGAWTGKLATPDTRAGVGADAPKNRKAQELFKVWLSHTRVNGKIPGGLVAHVGERVQEFVKANAADKAGAPYAKRMAPLVPRLDGTRDWQPAEAAAILGDIATVSDSPLSVALEEIAGGKVQHGLALPKELENAPWGEPLANGLRTACIIGPGVTSRRHYVDWVGNVVTRGGAPPDKAGAAPATVAVGTETRLGTPLGCRILIHNAGKEPVVFRTRSWHHIEPTAKDSQGAEIGVESVTRYTRAPLVTWRLEPGRYIELSSPGFGLGKYGYHDFGNADIASWIDAKAGDEVTVTPGPLPLNGWNESPAPAGEPRWWLDFIIARLSLATPLPADAAERGALLRQAMADLFRQDIRPTDEETAAFLKDTSPQALTNLAERIFHRPGLHAWAGPLQSGPTKFRVAAADQRGAKPAAAPAATPPAAAPAEKPKTGGESSAQRVLPKHKDAQALYESWSTAARADGKIPGALIGLLGESVKTFIKNNPTWKTTPQLEKMLSRFDDSHDWGGQEAVALLDELAAVQATPIGMALEREGQGIIGRGEPLPPQLARAPWGEATAGGLRVAYLLEPRLVYQRLGTPLKGRILIHNAGKQPVAFRAWSWHQAGHKATDAQGADINIFSLEWTTLGRLEPFRLAPGEFIEINTAGIGVGADRKVDDWQNIRVGSWVEAKEGDEVTVTTEPIPLNDGNEQTDGEPRWWLDHIKARLSRHQPFPADAEARKLIVKRVAMELFGTPASDEITNAFVADFRPTALDSLAQLLARRPGLAAFSGSLESRPTKFRVRPADPDAAKRPRVASNPGWYTLGEHVRLDVSRRRDGERVVNVATILFFSPDPKADAPGKPFPVQLPDGYSTWGAAWARGAPVMWVAQKGLLQKIDFGKPEKVEVARYEADNAASAPIPADIREALRAALAVPDAPKQVQEPLPSAAEAPRSERAK